MTKVLSPQEASQLKALLHWIAWRVALRFDKIHELDDLYGLAWVSALEALQVYDPNRGSKPTSFISMYVFRSLMRYLYRQWRQWCLEQRNVDSYYASLQPSRYELNPYYLSPEENIESYEEYLKVYAICLQNSQSLKVLLRKTPAHSSDVLRKRLSRARQKHLIKLRAQVLQALRS